MAGLWSFRPDDGHADSLFLSFSGAPSMFRTGLQKQERPNAKAKKPPDACGMRYSPVPLPCLSADIEDQQDKETLVAAARGWACIRPGTVFCSSRCRLICERVRSLLFALGGVPVGAHASPSLLTWDDLIQGR